MVWTVRAARPADVASVLTLWVEGEAEATHTDDAESLAKLLAHGPSVLFVAEDGGRLVGSIIAAWDGWRGSVYRLVVAPSHRRRGLGRELLERAESHLSGTGAIRSQAIVVDTESAATGFWQASGWECQTHRRRFVKG
jgi:ribosomal protein S18 acetylase RimI-like enzyme